MKIAYVRPYDGEIEIVQAALTDHEVLAIESIDELDEVTKATVDCLCVFVDYAVTADVIAALPNLQFVVTRSAGFDHVDTAALAASKLPLQRVPHYGTRTVAEYALALMFALSRNVYRSYTDMQQNAGVSQFEVYEGFDLCGKTLGVVGTGAIGRSVCEIARGIGMQVVAFDVSPDTELAERLGFSYASLEEVVQAADIVTIHVPSLPQTHHLINDTILRQMKPGAYLINTARGEIVDTKALVAALKDGHIAGAGLDVLEGEHELREEAQLLGKSADQGELFATLVADHALIDMPNVIVTPHIAFNTIEAKREITDITIQNIQSYVRGELENVVN